MVTIVIITALAIGLIFAASLKSTRQQIKIFRDMDARRDEPYHSIYEREKVEVDNGKELLQAKWDKYLKECLTHTPENPWKGYQESVPFKAYWYTDSCVEGLETPWNEPPKATIKLHTVRQKATRGARLYPVR